MLFATILAASLAVDAPICIHADDTTHRLDAAIAHVVPNVRKVGVYGAVETEGEVTKWTVKLAGYVITFTAPSEDVHATPGHEFVLEEVQAAG